MSVFRVVFVRLCLLIAAVRGFDTIDAETCIIRKDGQIGVCKKVVDCPPAFEELKKTKGHSFDRCDFVGLVEFVCCPEAEDSEETTENSTSQAIVRGPVIRKSIRACDEYSNEVAPKVEFQILGGIDASEGEFPHMAGLGFPSGDSDTVTWDCGGSLITNRYVLTAAHCVVRRDKLLPVLIRLGKTNIDANSDKLLAYDYEVEKVTVHPQYNLRTKINDIALILLRNSTVITEHVHPACLYDKPDDPKGLIITGWGTTKYAGNKSSILQKAFLDPVPVDKCNSTYGSAAVPRYIENTQFCALSKNKSDACQGDSGGPLQIQESARSIYSVVGITSYGSGCGGTFPGVYTRVYSYLNWIEELVWSS